MAKRFIYIFLDSGYTIVTTHQLEKNQTSFHRMSLALFHEYRESEQGIREALNGRFSSTGSSEFAFVNKSRIALFQTSASSAGSSLKYVVVFQW
jgi:hypothetical protein